MKKTIEFDTSAGKQSAITKPAYTGDKEPSFKNLILRDDLYKKKRKFEQGDHWLRFMPSIKGSKFPWLLKVDVYQDKAGVTFVSPTSFNERATDPFRIAWDWFKKNKPELLSKKGVNPDGFKLWPTPQGVAWAIDKDKPEGQRLSIYVASKYDGSRGGQPGVAHRLELLATERDTEPGSPTHGELIHGDISHPETGKLAKITVSGKGADGFHSYTVSIGKNVAPLAEYMDALTEEEHNLISPLENIIYVPTVEEIHDILKGYIGEELYKEIFAE